MAEQTVWLDKFDERQQKQIKLARLYDAPDFRHGADGHNNMLIISKMASLLDAAEEQAGEKLAALARAGEV